MDGIQVFRFEEPIDENNPPLIDDWIPSQEDLIFRNAKNIIFAPISQSLNIQSDSLDYFIIRSKKCYNSQDLRDHICKTLNYFEKFYDKDKELFMCIAHMKYVINSYSNRYTEDRFIHDIRMYLLNPSIMYKVNQMIEHNYLITLSYNNIAESLRYNDHHAKVLMCVSILTDFVIPLMCHYAHENKIGEIDRFILDVYDVILSSFDVDIYAKLYETAISNIEKSEKKNDIIWNKQGIRGKDTIIHARDCVNNILINIIPKYDFTKNVVSLNFTSIEKNTGYQILDIGYEFSFVPLSSSKRDGEDNSSEFEKYETSKIKDSEATYLQNKVNANETMKLIESQFGPFSDEDIEYYRTRLIDSTTGSYINNFQMQLIFNIFYRDFGDTEAIKAITNLSRDYIILMLAAKKKLEMEKMVIMPYVISGKFEKITPRKAINKKEEKVLQVSAYYEKIIDKYRNEKILNQIMSNFATVISSTIRFIDPHNEAIDGKIIDIDPSIILEELQLLTLLI